MKLCLKCENEFVDGWTCPSCSWSPHFMDGFYSFSPELADENDGLDSSAHHHLNELQDKSFWFRKRNQIIQDIVGRFFTNAMDVLEIGCGSGYVLSGIREVLGSARLTATEIYLNGLAYAANRVNPPSQFFQMDARHIPFKHEFDLVGAFDVLEHIDEDELVIKNIRNALKPGGGLIITVPQHQFLWSYLDEIACHRRRYSSKQLSQLLKMNGFEILLNTSFMFFLLPLMLLRKISKNNKGNHQSTELSMPRFIDNAFGGILEFERKIIRCGMTFPCGGSRLLVARVPASGSI